MKKIIEKMKAESLRMKKEADQGNVPNNEAWFQWRMMHIRGFNSAIEMLEKELAALNTDFNLTRS